jgi:hypothetical protein
MSNTLSTEGRQIVNRLRTQGICTCPASSLIATPEYLETLGIVAHNATVRAAEEINQRRTLITGGINVDPIVTCFGDRDFVDDKHTSLALAGEIPLVADAYFGQTARLRYMDVWKRLVTSHAPSGSHYWHRDDDAPTVLKVFVYLTKASHDNGALHYIPATHVLGHRECSPEFFIEPGHENRRTSDTQMSSVIPVSEWFIASGPIGTLVLADTTGFHRGSLCRHNEALVFTAMFTP